MVIIGFEDMDGNPVVKTEEEKKVFLEQMGYGKEDVIFADNISSKVVVGMALIENELNKK
jgi:hypothetical protein